MESRVYLRALEPDDYKTSIEWRRDNEIWGIVGSTKYFVSEAYEKKWVEDTIFNSRDIKLAVCEVGSNKYIGNVYATDIDQTNRSCTTGVLIGNHDYWSQGYASEAYRLLLDYLFNERNINRVQAYVLELATKDDIEYLLAYQMQPLPIDQRYGEEEMLNIIILIKNDTKKQFSLSSSF